MKMIADERILFRSPAPDGIYCYTPWICHGFGDRLIASCDIAGPRLGEVPGPKSDHGDYGSNQCLIFRSDDHGETWTLCARLPMLHARVFQTGKSLYILGHSGRMLIARSDDNGDSWSAPAVLDPGLRWHQSGGSIDRHHGRIWLSMEIKPDVDHWAGGDPLLMSADENDDLTKRSSWRFSNLVTFEQTAKFINRTPIQFEADCWLESSVVRVHDPKSRFYDPEDRSVLLFLRVNGCEHYAAMLVGRENDDGTLTLDTWKRPDGSPVIFFPFPGGHMKFHIVYDEQDQFYWMTASHVEISTAYGPPSNRERRALGLYCSSNLFDWQLAGFVAVGESRLCSRHYASLVIDGEDLLVVSRSGDREAKNSHDTDLITLHRVHRFRELALKGGREE